jgi:hypothetical protein
VKKSVTKKAKIVIMLDCKIKKIVVIKKKIDDHCVQWRRGLISYCITTTILSPNPTINNNKNKRNALMSRQGASELISQSSFSIAVR